MCRPLAFRPFDWVNAGFIVRYEPFGKPESAPEPLPRAVGSPSVRKHDQFGFRIQRADLDERVLPVRVTARVVLVADVARERPARELRGDVVVDRGRVAERDGARARVELDDGELRATVDEPVHEGLAAVDHRLLRSARAADRPDSSSTSATRVSQWGARAWFAVLGLIVKVDAGEARGVPEQPSAA